MIKKTKLFILLQGRQQNISSWGEGGLLKVQKEAPQRLRQIAVGALKYDAC